MIKFIVKIAMARVVGGMAGRVRPKGVKGMVMQALLQRLIRR